MTVPLWIVLAIAVIAVAAVWAWPPKGDLPKRPDSEKSTPRGWRARR